MLWNPPLSIIGYNADVVNLPDVIGLSKDGRDGFSTILNRILDVSLSRERCDQERVVFPVVMTKRWTGLGQVYLELDA